MVTPNAQKIIMLCALLLAFISASTGCRDDKGRAENVVWDEFIKEVIKAGSSRDFDAMLDKLTVYRVADGKELMDEIVKANPDMEYVKGAENPTDEMGREAMLGDVKMFVESYDDLFDGDIACLVTALDTEIKGPEIYSAIIWVEKDGKFCGIKIHQVWRKGNDLRVVEWVGLDGYESSRNVIKKRAVLERETLDSCDFPSEITYRVEIRN